MNSFAILSVFFLFLAAVQCEIQIPRSKIRGFFEIKNRQINNLMSIGVTAELNDGNKILVSSYYDDKIVDLFEGNIDAFYDDDEFRVSRFKFYNINLGTNQGDRKKVIAEYDIEDGKIEFTDIKGGLNLTATISGENFILENEYDRVEISFISNNFSITIFEDGSIEVDSVA